MPGTATCWWRSAASRVADELLATRGAEPRTLPWFAGRRALTHPGGAAAGTVVRKEDGRELSWLDLVTALRFRDRFLTRETTLGSVRFSTGDGGLSDPAPIDGTPAETGRWTRPTRFLLDRLVYSATEDALLGLRTLDHVDLAGEPSGGGRPRTVGLQAGVVLSVSTALTYEPDGRCVEGAGLAVDRELAPDVLATGAAVTAADTGW